MPSFAAQTGVSISVIGSLFFIGALGGTLCTLLGSWLFGWAPGRLALGLTQIITAVLMFFIPEVPWFGVLLLLCVLKGVSGGLINTGANLLLTWTFREKSSPIINALHFFFGLGSFLSPFVFGFLLSAHGTYHDMYRLLGCVGIIVGILALFLIQDAKPAPQEKPTGGKAVAPSVAPFAIAAGLYLFFYVSAEITYGGWVFTYATTRSLMDAVNAAYLTSLFWFAFTVGRLISIPLSMRFSPARIIPFAIAGGLGFLALGIALPPSGYLLWVISAGTGFCMAPLWANGYSLASRSIPMTAKVSGLILLGDSIGATILPGLLGVVIERAGAEYVFPIMTTSLLLTFFAFSAMILLNRKKLAMQTAAG
jgi:MFS transporter, FHS family, Na+ dependent glucose transporter 1